MLDNAKEAIDYYVDMLGATLKDIHYGNTIPGFENKPEAANVVVHSTLLLSNGQMMYIADSIKLNGIFHEKNKDKPNIEITKQGNHVQLGINFTDQGEQKKIYEKLTKGGKILMELKETFWGSIYALVEDKYKVMWHLNYELKK